MHDPMLDIPCMTLDGRQVSLGCKNVVDTWQKKHTPPPKTNG